jgi:DNA-binding MarR family transcriptional regulator
MPSDEMERLATDSIAGAGQMKRHCTDEGPSERQAAPASEPSDRNATLDRWCELASQLYRFRRRRDRMFGGMFGEPAWDILLDLFVMDAKGKRVPVSSACIASGASHSTALRQIDELVRCRLVMRERDEHDKRRTYLTLTDEGVRKMGLALEQLSEYPRLRMADVVAHPPSWERQGR